MKSESRKIILIMTDTQRHDMVGCYGNPDMCTPNIDRLAQDGIRFDAAYTAQPVCAPARSCIFTGMFPHSNGVWGNCSALGDNVRTIGKRMSDHGIHTAYIGKWHLDGGDYFGLGRCPDGWDPDYWFDMKNYLDGMSEEDRLLSRRSGNMRTHDFPAEFTYAYQCADRAADFLEKHSDEDFFLAVSFDEPHDPSLCPREYWEKFAEYEFPVSANVKDPLENKPSYQRAWAGGKLTEDRENYRIKAPFLLGCNSFVDTQIGRVIRSAEQLAPDATIIYTSDHGDFLGAHRLSGKGPAAYEEITHVPLIIRSPGMKGAVSKAPVSHADLAPTLFEMMGLRVPEVFEGKSLLPQLEDPNVRVNDCVFFEFGRYEVDHDGFGGFQPLRACFDGRYKLSVNLLDTDELYDLEADPEELCNQINNPAYASVRDRLHDALLKKMNDTRDPFRGYWWERRPWRTDAAPATWSYTGMTRQRVDDAYEDRQLDYATGLPITEAVRKK